MSDCLVSRQSPMPARVLALLALVPILLLAGTRAVAQDLEPRSYNNLPVGQHFLALGYSYSEGEINPSPSVPVRDIELDMHTTVAAYLQTLDLWGKAGTIDAVWARACQKGSGVINGMLVKGDRCGTTDPSFRLSYMLDGAPAMTLDEFRVRKPGRVLGVSLRVNAPLGDYNNENVINTGSNRWTFKPEIGMSNRWGQFSAEAAFAVRLFTDNDNAVGDTTLEQDPLYQLQSHLIYYLPRGRWLSLNANYFWGGETSKDGVKGDDEQDNSRVGATFSMPLNQRHSVKFFVSSGLISNIGNDSDNIGLVWQYRWSD